MRITLTLASDHAEGWDPTQHGEGLPDGLGGRFTEPDPDEPEEWPFSDAAAIYEEVLDAYWTRLSIEQEHRITAALTDAGFPGVEIATSTGPLPRGIEITVSLDPEDDRAALIEHYSQTAHWPDHFTVADHEIEDAIATDDAIEEAIATDLTDAAEAAEQHAADVALWLRAGYTWHDWETRIGDDRPTVEEQRVMAILRT
jgi:hypothetical protein